MDHILREFKGMEMLKKGKLSIPEMSSSDLNIVERIITKLIRQQVHINEMQSCLMPEHGAKKAIFILRQIQK